MEEWEINPIQPKFNLFLNRSGKGKLNAITTIGLSSNYELQETGSGKKGANTYEIFMI